MRGVIPDTGRPGNDGRDPRQGPQIGGEAVGRRALQQRRLYPGQLLAIEARFAARPAGGLQRPSAFRPPRVIPPMGGHPAEAQLPSNGRLRGATSKQPRGLEPPRFQPC